ncbi:MAG: hypothetical protein GY936_00795 [Ignavibacteriae bacterium]|nr:hypothetical protein [Ignavibacteriota bacterium]
MGNLAVNNSTLNKYFGILEDLDVDSKKNLIIKLTKSIQSNPKTKLILGKIYGSWQDSRTADEIIAEIESSRFNNRDIEELYSLKY